MKKTLKKALIFTLVLIPIAAVAGFFTARFQMASLDQATIDMMVQQLGDTAPMPAETMIMVITAAQTVLYAVVCGFFGYILADRTGLIKPFRVEKKPLAVTLGASLIAGVVVSLDYWTFGALDNRLRENMDVTLSADSWLASVLYGGVIEEVMMRLFLMSLVTWLLWKVFARKSEKAPLWTAVTANIAAALLFAAGHLPSTLMLFGSLTPLLLVRCFLLNGCFGAVFGELYRKYGIQYAIIAHALAHIVSKTIWIVFI